MNWPFNILVWRGWCLLNYNKGAECENCPYQGYLPSVTGLICSLQHQHLRIHSDTFQLIFPCVFLFFTRFHTNRNLHVYYDSFLRHKRTISHPTKATSNPSPNTKAVQPTTPSDASRDSWSAAQPVMIDVTVLLLPLNGSGPRFPKKVTNCLHVASQLLAYDFAVQI